MSRTITQDSVLFGGTMISYRIRRSAERHSLAITVAQDQVTVTIPSGMRAMAVQPFVLGKGAWIVSKLDEDRRLRKHWPRKLVSGESICYLGRQYQLKVHKTLDPKSVGLRLWGGVFHLIIVQTESAEARLVEGRELFRRWFRNHLELRLGGYVARFAKSLRLPTPKFRVLDLGGRWGSCNLRGSLAFHWHLAAFSPRLIEYVVAHEMCHLRHERHDRDFYKLLSRIMPDWKAKHEELQMVGPGSRL